MKDFIKKCLLDETDSPSTKRIIALVGSGLLFVALLLNSFLPLDPSGELITGVVTVICVCLGASSIDKFSAK